MDKERSKIDQKLCDTVKMMMAGKDAKVSQVVELLGISQATVNRIRQAGYSLEQFNKDKSSRNERKKELKGKKQAEEQEKEEQVPGQISMDLQPAEEQKPEMSDQTKLMRFQAGQAEKIIGQMMVNVDALLMKMDRLNDTLSMILRKMDG